MNKPLWVIDTNVVLDLLHFDDVAARPLRLALEDGRVRCVVSDGTLAEWRRVLAYPEFGLDSARQATLFARYEALAVKADAVGGNVGLPHNGTLIHSGLKPMWSRMPRCSDPDDQQFIELAAAAGAQGLISRDRAVLKLRRRCAPQFRIQTPAEAVRLLDDSAA
ncbi:MAG TPA: PIN domain-containing protein [Thiobacillus sp.]